MSTRRSSRLSSGGLTITANQLELKADMMGRWHAPVCVWEGGVTSSSRLICQIITRVTSLLKYHSDEVFSSLYVKINPFIAFSFFFK